ncbi:MAG TPA: hypothetical protein VGB24_10800 [Longimicrobium sp.]|jgi:hypothetical protein|uniref:hypothetical protein n=1 Tax=Longimicrobium sp. TaxID=2029185 RepID=UPI002ED7895D
MRTRNAQGDLASPLRLLEMLEFRFGAFEAIATTSLELSRKGPENGLPMDRGTAEAILEFRDDLKQAYRAALEWADAKGLGGGLSLAEADDDDV